MSEGSNALPVSALAMLAQVGLLLGQAEGDQALFRAVLDGLASICGAGRVSMLAAGPEEGGLRVLATSGVAKGEAAAVAEGASPAVQRALADGQPHFDRADEGSPGALALPLLSAGRAVGVIYAGQLATQPGEADLSASQALANLAAVALERAGHDEALAATEQARREYVSLTTHQLRVPLTSLSGYTDLMLNGVTGPLNERQEQFLRTIRRNAERMALLIADLSDLNRIQDGRFPLQIFPVNIGELIETTLQEQAQMIAALGHRLQRHVPDGLPPAQGDRAAVKRIFEKLLTNAALYTPEGGSITVAAVRAGDRVQITVADDGIGIPPDDQAKLFTPFFRSEVKAVRQHVGWGLSLALARALIEVQGGRLWYESQEGTGSAFHFALPVAGTEAD